VDHKEVELIPLITGSIAEFYIEPMLPHVSDIDVMRHLNTELAIPRGHPPPTQLPAEFHNYVFVAEIIDSHLPGYVYSRVRYLLAQSNYTEYDKRRYLLNRDYKVEGTHIRHGPAVLTNYNEPWRLPFDVVYCIRCLSWPPQSADWRTRHRNYSWPDSATVDRVVSNGCDVVGVAHRQCRQDEWMGKR